jgi:site-specific recombinase XerD
MHADLIASRDAPRRGSSGILEKQGVVKVEQTVKPDGTARKIGPHALRHYAATSILKQTGDLELVRQVLRHESLAMALRYAHIAKPEISRKFRRASPLDNLRVGR